jgi:hypothetical protein
MVARAMRLRVVELPVVWKEVDGSHIRPIADPLRMAWDVMTAKIRSGKRVAVLEVTKDQVQEHASISDLAGCSADIAVVIELEEKFVAFLPFVSMAEASHIQKLGATALGIDFDSIRLREIGRKQAIRLMARRVAKF